MRYASLAIAAILYREVNIYQHSPDNTGLSFDCIVANSYISIYKRFTFARNSLLYFVWYNFMTSYNSKVMDKTITSSFPDYIEICNRRTKKSIGGKSFQLCVLKNKDANLGHLRRGFEGFGLFILTLSTLGLALLSDRVCDRWQETIDGRGVKYIKLALTDLDRRLSSSSLPLLGMSTSPAIKIEEGKGAAMHTLLESLVTTRGFSGTVLVVDHGKIILKNGYGKANAENMKPMTVETRFPIGSVTKPITSLAILKLVEDGYFLDSQTAEPILDPAKIKILDFLPKSLQPNNEVRESWKEVTLLDLMNHTSGLPSFSDKAGELMKAKGGRMSAYLSPTEVIDLVRNEPLRGKGNYCYSNFGYHLLGKIIEQVTKQSYESYINHFLQDRLGLKETGYVGTDTSHASYAEPMIWDDQQHRVFSANKDELDPPSEAYSSGGLYSTSQDLQVLFSKLTSDTKERITEGVKVEKDPRKDPDFRQQFTCMQGWNITSGEWNDSNGKPIQEVWKTGAVGGYGSLAILYPNQDSAIIILSNQPRDVEAISSDLSHALFVSSSSTSEQLSSWEGLYRIPDWGLTFSIAKQGFHYVLRETHPARHEVVLDSSSNAEQIAFPWGPKKELHFIKRMGVKLFLCTLDGQPIKGAEIDKII